MKAIMISIKPKWCAKIMNGEKTIEVRKNKALANAIKKLIAEYGFADIFVHCSKEKPYLIYEDESDYRFRDTKPYQTHNYKNRYLEEDDEYLNGKVVFKFRCYKVEEIKFYNYDNIYETDNFTDKGLRTKSCLSWFELNEYLNKKLGYAIHIGNLEIFGEPKELSEFYTTNLDKDIIKLLDNSIQLKNGTWVKPLTKAPQNFCYVEVRE